MTIEHPEYGRVVGVERQDNIPAWVLYKKSENDGGYYVYLEFDGWREVVQERDVTNKYEPSYDSRYEKAQCLVRPSGIIFCELPTGSHWRKVQAVVLPEGMTWRDFWFKNWADKAIPEHINSPEHVCEAHQTTCLQICEGER